MELYIVTVKQESQKHPQSAKKKGECDFSDKCTDIEGAHHSFLYEGNDVDEIYSELIKKYHITRIERAFIL